jgi:hypothetical protein
VVPSPWANFLTVGLKILTAILGGGTGGGDGIDKVDNGSPMQVSYKIRFYMLTIPGKVGAL